MRVSVGKPHRLAVGADVHKRGGQVGPVARQR
jgi:hypothetical protein